MAYQKITELPIKNASAINLADYLLGIDAADGYQMLISDLAKKIVETYAGSSLAGSAQTLKAAIDALNGKFTTPEPLGIVLASSNYSCVRGFAYRIGKMVFVSVVMNSSSQIPAGQGLFRLDYATNQSITPAISNLGAASVNWTLVQMMPAVSQFIGTARAEAGGHHYIASGSTVSAGTDIYVVGSFICQ